MCLDTLVGHVRAHDPDDDTIAYSLRHAASPTAALALFVERQSGALRVAAMPPTNTSGGAESLELEIVASDGVHSASAAVRVRLVDTKAANVGDALRLRARYFARARENQTSTSQLSLLPIAAIEWPSNSRPLESFRYELLTRGDKSADDAIVVAAESGLVYLNASRPLDRETTTRIEYAIGVVSNEDERRRAQTILQLDIDDVGSRTNDCNRRTRFCRSTTTCPILFTRRMKRRFPLRRGQMRVC